MARGTGGSALMGRSPPWPQCGQSVDVDPEHSKKEGFHGFCFAKCGGGGMESGAGGGQVLGAAAVVANAFASKVVSFRNRLWLRPTGC